MTKEIRMAKSEKAWEPQSCGSSSFELRHSFVIRHSCFVISVSRIAQIAFCRLFALMRQLLTAICVCVIGQSLLGEDLNGLILDQVKNMPQGGQYSVSRFATIRLQSAAHFESGKFFILPTAPFPSFCSGATYLVFIKTIEALRASGQLHLDFATLEQLIIRDQHDGEGIWGRWNANGPGTARLFHELGLGRNFTDFNDARAGDFMKIFWSREVGRKIG